MNKQVETRVKTCQTCQKLLPSKSPQPINPPSLSTRPWQKVGANLFHNGAKDYLITTDYYSLWPEVYLLKQTLSKNIIEAMQDMFACHGIPEEIMSNNGPQFISNDFNKFSKEWQFNHVTSSPRFPQSNGLAEAAVKTVKTIDNKKHTIIM